MHTLLPCAMHCVYVFSEIIRSKDIDKKMRNLLYPNKIGGFGIVNL